MKKIRVARLAIPPAPTRKRLAPDERRDQILQEAISLLTEQGVTFNTRELADRLKISHPLLFRYFKSRDEIVDAVFNTVFLERLTPDILAALGEQTADVVGKWTRFYESYAPKIFDRVWVRIFISSALLEDLISRRYFDLVVIPVVTALAEDTERHCFGGPSKPDSPVRLISLELAWMTHSSVFYNGLRRWVYGLEVPDEIGPIMSARVRAHFAGAQAAFDVQKGV